MKCPPISGPRNLRFLHFSQKRGCFSLQGLDNFKTRSPTLNQDSTKWHLTNPTKVDPPKLEVRSFPTLGIAKQSPYKFH